MSTLATIWLLVVMSSTGELKVIDMQPSQTACTAILAKAPASDGMCIAAVAAAPKR